MSGGGSPGVLLVALDELVGTVHGLAWTDAREPADVDLVAFPDGGGTSDLGLAIRRLPEMDEVVVDEAYVTVHALSNPVDLRAPHVVAGGGGTSILDLGGPSRLVALDVTLSAALPPDGHILVSTDVGGVRTPLFAAPALSPDLALYPAPLTGMSSSATSGSVRLAFHQPVGGSRWAVSVATGDKASSLARAAGITVTVTGAVVDASPTDLTLTIPGNPETVLLSTPGPLLPGGAPHRIDFAPLAQRHLQAGLAAPTPGSDPSVLAVPVRLRSSTAGRVGIVERTLTAAYRVRIAPAAPLVTGGDWALLDLVVPAGRRPVAGSITFRAKLDGTQLDPAFGPTPANPVAGLQIAPRSRVAASTAATPGPDGTATVVAARLRLETTDAAEVVLEVRADAANLPGEVLATVVRRIPASASGWQAFSLASPLTVPAPARLWCVVRTNDAPARWFAASGADAALLSEDDGATWRAPKLPLVPSASPLIQLLRPDPGGPPRLDVYLGSGVVGSLDLARSGARDAGGVLELPPSVLDGLGRTVGTGRITTTLALWSPTTMSFTVADGVCRYDPSG